MSLILLFFILLPYLILFSCPLNFSFYYFDFRNTTWDHCKVKEAEVVKPWMRWILKWKTTAKPYSECDSYCPKLDNIKKLKKFILLTSFISHGYLNFTCRLLYCGYDHRSIFFFPHIVECIACKILIDFCFLYVISVFYY